MLNNQRVSINTERLYPAVETRFLLRTLRGQCPNSTSPNYWGYHFQQILEGDVQNPPKLTHICQLPRLATCGYIIVDDSTDGFKGPFYRGKSLRFMRKKHGFRLRYSHQSIEWCIYFSPGRLLQVKYHAHLPAQRSRHPGVSAVSGWRLQSAAADLGLGEIFGLVGDSCLCMCRWSVALPSRRVRRGRGLRDVERGLGVKNRWLCWFDIKREELLHSCLFVSPYME